MTEHSSSVTLSTCTEQNQSWGRLVSVPVTLSANGSLQVPIAEAIRENKKEEELANLRKGSDLFSVKREFEGAVAVTTYLPLKNVHFQFGKADPVDPKELEANVNYLSGKLKAVIDGAYHCIKLRLRKLDLNSKPK